MAFLPRKYAQERAVELRALANASSLAGVVALELPHLGGHFDDFRAESDARKLDDDYDDEEHDLDEDISRSEGDFPPMLAQWAVDKDLFPLDVLVGVGAVEETIFSGPLPCGTETGRRGDRVSHSGWVSHRTDDDLVLRCRYTDADVATARELAAGGSYGTDL